MPDVTPDLDRDERGREAEITPEMIEARVNILMEYDSRFEPNYDETVADMFRAMLLVADRNGASLPE